MHKAIGAVLKSPKFFLFNILTRLKQINLTTFSWLDFRLIWLLILKLSWQFWQVRIWEKFDSWQSLTVWELDWTFVWYWLTWLNSKLNKVDDWQWKNRKIFSWETLAFRGDKFLVSDEFYVEVFILTVWQKIHGRWNWIFDETFVCSVHNTGQLRYFSNLIIFASASAPAD